jgi:hypothetical protein
MLCNFEIRISAFLCPSQEDKRLPPPPLALGFSLPINPTAIHGGREAYILLSRMDSLSSTVPAAAAVTSAVCSQKDSSKRSGAMVSSGQSSSVSALEACNAPVITIPSDHPRTHAFDEEERVAVRCSSFFHALCALIANSPCVMCWLFCHTPSPASSSMFLLHLCGFLLVTCACTMEIFSLLFVVAFVFCSSCLLFSFCLWFFLPYCTPLLCLRLCVCICTCAYIYIYIYIYTYLCICMCVCDVVPCSAVLCCNRRCTGPCHRS